MGIRFILGRAGSGKSRFALNSIKKITESETKAHCILVVPEQSSLEAQKCFLNVLGERYIEKAEVLSFKRMAEKLMNETGGLARKRLNSSGKNMLVYNILEKRKDEFKTFKMAARQKGFVNTISGLLSEFKRFNLTPDALKEAAELLNDNEELKDKLSDLEMIYSDFEDSIHEKYLDTDDDLTILANGMKDWKFIRKTNIFIDEFSSFTPQQYAVIYELLKYSNEVDVSLCLDPDMKIQEIENSIFRVTYNTKKRLEKMAEELSIYPEEDANLNSNKNNRYLRCGSIGFLERTFFDYSAKPCSEEVTSIGLYRASNIYSEIEYAARRIIELVRDKNLRYNSIAVAARSLDGYEDTIRAVFSEYGIPNFIDNRKEVQGNLIIILVSSALNIIYRNWTYESVFVYLKTYLTGIDRNDTDMIENYVLEFGINGEKSWTSDKDWNYGKDKYSIEKINETKRKIAAPLLKLKKSISKSQDIKAICTAIYEFLKDLEIEEKVQNLIEKFQSEGRIELVNEYKGIFNLLMDTMDQMVESLKGEKVDIKKLIDIFNVGLSEEKMGAIPPSLDQVLVSSLDRLKTHNVRALFILNVNDGSFPLLNSDEGILSDSDRNELMNLGYELADDTRRQAIKEQFLVYSSLTIASDYLFVSYLEADFEGKSLRPSMIINRIKDIFPKLAEESELTLKSDDAELELVSREVPSFNHMISERRIRNIKSEVLDDLYLYFERKPEWTARLKNAEKYYKIDNSEKNIKKENVFKIYGDNLHLSSSRFEKFVECPFGYFVQYGLKADERKIHTLSAPDLGTFMHTVLYEFAKRVNNENDSWNNLNDDTCLKYVEEITDDIIKKETDSIFLSSPRYRYFTNRFKKVLKRTCGIIRDQVNMGNFLPTYLEKEFREGAAYPPIVVELPDKTRVNIVGKIDRIDMLEKNGKTYIRIIDYKSGVCEFSLSDVYYGLRIQLLLYLDAVLNASKEENVLPGGILYFKIDDPLVKTDRKMTGEEIKKEIIKSFKLKGLVLKDVDVVKEMDKNISGSSLVIPAYVKKDGELGQSSAIDLEHFELLRKHVLRNIKKCCIEMLKGNIEINPVKTKANTACSYCLYSSICQFENGIYKNRYRTLETKSDNEVLNLIESEGEEDGNNVD